MPGWKPSRMPPGCSQAKPSSCEPGAFHSRGSTDPIPIVLGCPRERSPLISRARFKICADAQTIVGAFRESVRCSMQRLRNPPEPSQGKNMSTTDKKATAATSETMDEAFHEAMRSYEKALKSGIQLQEESVNLWKDLLTKLGSPEELQAKLEAMTADAFPQARKLMEEFVNRTSNQTIDLFEKTLGAYQAPR